MNPFGKKSSEAASDRWLHVAQARKQMATTFEFVVSCRAGQEAAVDSLLSAAHAEVARLEDVLSEYRETPLAAFNRAPVGAWVPLPLEVLELLVQSRDVTRASGGAFDCTAKSQPRGAGAGESFETRVECDLLSGGGRRHHEGVHVGFGAIGKGYALDRVAALLEKSGLRDFFLSAGGSSLLFSGLALPARPWVFGWSWGQDRAGSPLGQRFEVKGTRRVALGVSGLQEQAHHLLDPRQGGAVLREGPHPWRSVCLAHSSAAAADAWSTALFVRGLEGFPFPGAFAGLDSGGVLRWNGAFEALFPRAGESR